VANLHEMDLVTKGKDFFERKEYDRAFNLFSEVIELTDTNVEAFYYLANIFHMRGEIGKAIKAFNKVLTLDPCHTDASISLSVLYNDIGHYEAGKKVFKQASQRVKSQKKSEPEDQHVNKKFSLKHLEDADLYLSYNRFDEALFEYEKAIGLDPSNLECRIKVAKVYAKRGFTSKALDELKKLLNEHPSYMPARMALGILYYGMGRVLEAQTEWEKVASREPFNAEAKMYLNLTKNSTETHL